DRVVGREGGAQLRILHARLEVAERAPAQHARPPAPGLEGGPVRLEPGPDPGAVEALPARDVLEGPLLAGGERAIEARDHVVGRALEDVQPGGPLRELRDELERARRVADHRDALAGDVEIV